MSRYKHIMLDIETLGTKPYCVILSIGAVEFDMHSTKTGRQFYKRINIKSCTNAGLIMDPDTIIWWMRQSEQARQEITSKIGTVSIQNALNELTKFFKKADKEVEIWANSHSFDCNHLQEAYEKVLGGDCPWSYKQPRCYRTITSMSKDKAKAVGVQHNAVDDCLYQIDNLRLAVKSMGISKYIK